jgi:tetratricopeptide (TPR) repeat protein
MGRKSELTIHTDFFRMWRGMARLIFATMLLVDFAALAAAGTNTRVPRNCKSEFAQWQKREGYGAFAAASNGACGWTWQEDTAQSAKSDALQNCKARSKTRPCKIIAENNSLGDVARKADLCDTERDGNYKEKINACTWLIASPKTRNGSKHWAYNERGRIQQDHGNSELAIEDYSLAIVSDESMPWPYMNRSKAFLERGQLNEALRDAKKALANFGADKTNDVRKDAKNLIEELEIKIENRRKDVERLPALLEVRDDSLRNADLKTLCFHALGSKKDAWETGTGFLRDVVEVQRRGKSVGDCRLELGYQLSSNRFESYTASNLCLASIYYEDKRPDGDANLVQLELQRRAITNLRCHADLGIPVPSPAAVTAAPEALALGKTTSRISDQIREDFLLARELGTTDVWEAFILKYGQQADDFYVKLAVAAKAKISGTN